MAHRPGHGPVRPRMGDWYAARRLATPLARRRPSRAAQSLSRSEELVLAAEGLRHRVVGEDAADRVGEDVGHGEDLDVLRRALAQRDRVRDDDLLERRGGEVLE